jgi:hypothetical protein
MDSSAIGPTLSSSDARTPMAAGSRVAVSARMTAT